MRKTISIILAALLLMSGTAFSLPVLDSVESIPLVAAAAETEESAVLTAESSEMPGLNLWTGTTEPYTFENTVASELHTYNGTALAGNESNHYVEFTGSYSNFTLNKQIPSVDKDRPVKVTFKFYNAGGAKDVRLIRNVLNNVTPVLTSFITAATGDWVTKEFEIKGVDAGDVTNYSSIYTDNTQNINNIIFLCVNDSSATPVRFDDISVVPAYKVTYDANGGTGTADADYFFGTHTALDSGSSLSNGTKEFLGWSLTPDGEAVTSVTGTPGSDVTLYAVWSKEASPEPANGVRPGLNVFTGTASAITFDNETENAKIVKSNAEIVTKAKGDDTNNKAIALNGTFSSFYLDVFEIEKDRPVQITFDYIYGAPFRIVVNKNATVDDLNGNGIRTMWEGAEPIEGWKTAPVYTYYGDAQKNPDKLSYTNDNNITRFYFNAMDVLKSKVYIDNIKIVPGYKVNYDANGGSGTVEPDYFTSGTYTSLDDGKSLSGGKTKKFAGWSLSPDGEAVTSVTGVPGNDITLYAIWEEIDVLLSWDFETEASQVWSASNSGYSTEYKNGMYVVDTTNGTSSSYIRHNDLTADNDTEFLKYMVIKARSLGNVSQLKMYFRTTDSPAFDEDKTVYFRNIHTNAQTFREYVVDMSANAYWTGDYINCMLATSAGRGIIEIEEIYFTSEYTFEDDTAKEYQYDLSGGHTYTHFGNTNIKNNGNGTYTVLKSPYYLYPDGSVKYYKYDVATGEVDTTVSTDGNGNPLTSENGKPVKWNEGAFYTYDTASLSLDSNIYNMLVIKTKNANGIVGFYVYYATTNSAGYTGEKMLSATKYTLDDGYTYFVADMSELDDFVGNGNVKSFMIQPSGTGTVEIHGMYLTNSFTAGQEITVEKLILYSTADSITTDLGTVTVYPYVRYSDGTEPDDFSDVYYVTDSVNAQIKKNPDGTATVTGQINGTVGISAVIPSLNARVTKIITIENQSERIPATSLKVSMFGNSILHHGPAPADGWNGNWGMAASSYEQSYAYRIIHYLSEKYGSNTATIASTTNFSTFEREIKGSGTEKDWLKDEKIIAYANTVKNAQPDIITIQMGENVASDVTVEEYTHATTSLITALQQAAPDALIVVCTPFWGGANKVDGMKATADSLDLPIALLHPLGEGAQTSKNENFAFNSLFLKEAGCTSVGIMVHPGDVGMDNIAKLIFEQINIRFSENEPTVYTVTPKSIEITTATGEYSIDTPYGTLQLASRILPLDAVQDVEWTVDNEFIGTVSEDGLVSAVNDGILKVTATSKHMAALSETVEIVITSQTLPHTVTYHANTTDVVENLPEVYSFAKENYTISETYPERTTYSFLGWSFTQDGEIVDSSIDVTQDITLYAQWEKAYRWDFNRTGYLEMFTAQNAFNNRVDDGIYQAIATGTNVELGQILTINSPKLSLNADDYKALVISMTNTEFASDTVVSLTVLTTNGEVNFTKPVTTSEKTAYEFMLEGITGTITGFKLVPTNIDCTVTIDSIEFAGYNTRTLDVASIRTSEPQGMRFAGYVSTHTVDLFEADEYGFIVAADDCFVNGDYSELKFNESNQSSARVGNSNYRYISAPAYVRNSEINVGELLTGKSAAELFTTLKSYTLDDGYYFSAILTNIPASHYRDRIVARTYVKINGEYVYGEAVVRSIYEIAVQYREQYGENVPEYIENIISLVESE